MQDDIPTLRRILSRDRTIAVVGLSAEWHRPSYFAAKYEQSHGVNIVQGNPRYAAGVIIGGALKAVQAGG
jgi:predicted CoA-binding protein